MSEEKTVNLSPPWYGYHRKVKALFERDTEVQVKDLSKSDDGQYNYMILVYNKEKAEAIKSILPQTVQIGNITVNVTILGPDENATSDSEKSILDIYNAAFSGNPIFEKTLNRQYGCFSKNFCIFKKEVIQFWNDNLADYCGNYNGLASDIAEEILTADDISFCISAES